MSRAVAAWNTFWFRPTPAGPFVVFRTLIGFISLAWGLSFLSDLRAFYFSDGLNAGAIYSDYRYGIFRWFDSDWMIGAVYAAVLVAAAAVMVGRGTRLAAPVLWIGMLSFQRHNPVLLNGGDDLLRAFTLYLAIYSVLTPSRVLRISHLGPFPKIPPWGLRLVQIQMTIVYASSVIIKLGGDTWLDGTAALLSMELIDFERFPVPGFITDNLIVGRFLTWATLLVEAVLPVLLWIPRLRGVAILMGLGLHLSFDYPLRVGFFGWIMTAGLLAFLPPEAPARAAAWLRRLLGRERRPQPVASN